MLRGHHVRYRGDLRACTVEDILTLCEKCHTKFHKDKKQNRKKKRRNRQQIKAFHEGRAAWWRLLHNVPTHAFVIPLYDREDALECHLFLMEQLV